MEFEALSFENFMGFISLCLGWGNVCATVFVWRSERNREELMFQFGDKYIYLLNYHPDPEAISNFHDCSGGMG